MVVVQENITKHHPADRCWSIRPMFLSCWWCKNAPQYIIRDSDIQFVHRCVNQRDWVRYVEVTLYRHFSPSYSCSPPGVASVARPLVVTSRLVTATNTNAYHRTVCQSTIPSRGPLYSLMHRINSPICL